SDRFVRVANPVSEQILWHNVEMFPKVRDPKPSQCVGTRNLRLAEGMFVHGRRRQRALCGTRKRIALSVACKIRNSAIDLSAEVNRAMRRCCLWLLNLAMPDASANMDRRILFNPTGVFPVLADSDRK